MTHRYIVGYARPCGNTWEAGRYATWDEAQAVVEATRDEHARRNWRSCVYMTDDENPEAGDIADIPPEDRE